MDSKGIVCMGISMLVAMAMTMPFDITQMGDPLDEMDSGAAPVNLTVYYESLCFGCIGFITGPLVETWTAIGHSGMLNVHLIPFGNAEVKKDGDRYIFKCQHGPKECLGNILETCIIHYEPIFQNHFEALICVEKNFYRMNVTSVLQLCADRVKTDLNVLKECVTSDLGNKLEYQMAMRTGSHSYVPWPLVNGKLDDSNQTLTAVICNAYKGPKPEGCPR